MRNFFRPTGLFAALAIGTVIMTAPGKSFAASYLSQLNTTFSGTAPAGPGPYVNELFTDVSPGTVSVTFSNVGLTGTEFISGLYINLNTNMDATQLNLQLIGETAGLGPVTISLGRDAFKADGDGKYDLLFSFTTDTTGRFAQSDWISYKITGIPTLTAADFNYLSAPAGGVGPFISAAHVQSIGSNGDSGWIRPTDYSIVIAPEPASGAVLALGAVVLFARRWRSSNS